MILMYVIQNKQVEVEVETVSICATVHHVIGTILLY